MSKSFYSFESKSPSRLSVIGGKAHALTEARKEGFPVPLGFVLSVEFFKPWMSEVEKSKSWKSFLKSSEVDLKKNCDAVKKECKALSFNTKQRTELERALQIFSGETLFAVRSSSPEEDLEGTSFAGAYETSLGVTENKLEKAILHSFVSVFDERIVKYKMQHDMKTNQPRIAVIVQEQIDSKVSGVAFSLNPQNNCYDEAVINASFGLGESIVAGQVTPDSYIVDKVKKIIIEKRISKKEQAIWLKEKGGTETNDNLKPEKASLTDEQALELTNLLIKVEDFFEKPIDIEWAYGEKKLHLLQARPITAYLPLPPEMITKPGEPKLLYQDALLMEQGIQEPMSIMGSDIYNDMIEIMIGPQMATIASDPRQGIFMSIHGKGYLNASNTIKAFGKRGLNSMMASFDAPTGKIMDGIDYDEYLPKKTPKKLRGIALKMLPLMFKMSFGFLRVYVSPEKVLKKYKACYETDLKRIDSIQIEGRAFESVYKEVLEILIDHMLNIFDMLLGPLYSAWRLKKIFKDQAINDLIVKLHMNLSGNPTAGMGRHMYELAKFSDIQNCKDAKTFAKKLKANEFSKEFVDAYESFMSEFGFRCIREIDPATPRPYENPEQFFQQLSLIHIYDESEENLLVKARKEQVSAEKKLRKIAKKLGKERKLNYHVNMIRGLAGYREVPKYLMVKIIDVIRRKCLDLGEQFVKEGRLIQAEDIFSLKANEIIRAEKNSKMDLIILVDKNTRYTRRVAHQKDWPRVVDSRGKIFRAPRQNLKDGIQGDAISPGKYIGKVKVLSNPYDKPLEKGEILVTRATDPGWTPLFMNAGAVILEVGGSLQHGAVIAREYGLPCVSGVEGAATRFKDGQIVEVDGSNGVVRIVD
ncbi:MAG: phosphoenolpyruvate synthase/pyruvate phosphate dikinase [Oceanicoccus sp.]|jgi:phosphoenolpyruvate synthase/pyruvate phosphate dikinase